MLRPLADAGTRQAHVLAASSVLDPAMRVFSSPARRCVDTVAPLARRAGVQVEIDELLYEGRGSAALEGLRGALRSAPSASIVACTHGDVLASLLNALVHEDGLVLPDSVRWAEASTWIIDFDDAGAASAATYRTVD